MRTAYVLGAAIGLVAAFLVAEPLIKVVEFRDLLLEKHGLIVDADTGRGLPGVAVTVNWTASSDGISGSSGGCDVQHMVLTDAEGNYTIPTVYGEVKFDRIWWKKLLARLLGVVPPEVSYNWNLVPFKQGYVRVGDETKIQNAVLADHQPDRSFPFYWNAPPYRTEVGRLQIEPIALRKMPLSPTDEMVYDFSLYMRSTCTGYPLVRDTMKASAIALPCQLPETQILDAQVVRAFAAIAGDHDFFGRMNSMTGTSLWEMKKEPAGLVCEAIGSHD